MCGAGMAMQLGFNFTLEGETFAVGIQLPLPFGPPPVYIPKLAAGLGLYIRTDTDLTGKDIILLFQ